MILINSLGKFKKSRYLRTYRKDMNQTPAIVEIFKQKESLKLICKTSGCPSCRSDDWLMASIFIPFTEMTNWCICDVDQISLLLILSLHAYTSFVASDVAFVTNNIYLLMFSAFILSNLTIREHVLAILSIVSFRSEIN